jgi:methanogenic corrinoid protein MtbC1
MNRPAERTHLAELRDRYLQLQLQGDRRAALHFIESVLCEGVSVREVRACVPDEHHEFPARLLADALEVAGYDVRFLGADVPLDSLRHSIDTERPDVVALSITMQFHLPALRETVIALRAMKKQGMLIAIGGGLFESSPLSSADIGADLVSADADGFISQLATRFGTAA